MPSPWTSRIVGHTEEEPESLLANPYNYRIHSTLQQEHVANSLEQFGWVREVLQNDTTGHIVDGHARVALAIRHQQPTVPVTHIRVTVEEEKTLLAILDPLVGQAGIDPDLLKQLAEDVDLSGFWKDEDLEAVFNHKTRLPLFGNPDDEPPLRELPKQHPSEQARHPLAIVLTNAQKREWDEWKDERKVKDDTVAFLALLKGHI